MGEIGSELLKIGLLGPIVVGLAVYVLRLQKQIEEVQAKRTLDAQAVSERLLALSEKWSGLIAAHTAAMENQADTLNELKDAVRDILRGRRP